VWVDARRERHEVRPDRRDRGVRGRGVPSGCAALGRRRERRQRAREDACGKREVNKLVARQNAVYGDASILAINCYGNVPEDDPRVNIRPDAALRRLRE
jgi:hypothetical protein